MVVWINNNRNKSKNIHLFIVCINTEVVKRNINIKDMDKRQQVCDHKPKPDVIDFLKKSDSEQYIDKRPVHEGNSVYLTKHELMLRANM